MSRESRLRSVIPNAADAIVAELAAEPVAKVDLIVAALRQAKRDALNDAKLKRAQRRTDARAHHWFDESELGARNLRMLDAQGRRATGGDLRALAWLAQSGKHTEALIRMSVESLFARNVSEQAIADALGVTRQAVWQRFRRKGVFAEDRAS